MATACDATVRWSSDTTNACAKSAYSTLDYTTLAPDYQKMLQICRASACLAIVDAMKAANPSECSTKYFQLYADLITPLEAVCRSQATTPAPTPNQPVVTPAPAPPAATPTTQAPATAPSPATTTATPKATARGETSEPAASTAPSAVVSSAGSDNSDTPSPSKSESSSQTVTPSPDSEELTPSPPSSSSSSASSESAASDSGISTADKRSGRPPTTSDSEQISIHSASSASSSHVTTISVVAAVALLVLLGLWLMWRSKRKAKHSLYQGPAYTEVTTTGTTSSASSQPLQAGAPDELASALTPLMNWRIDVRELRDVSLIGSGAQGAVVLVKFNDNRALASKRLIHDQFNEKKLRVLIAEVDIISTLQHPSIVSFVGVAWTSSRDFQVLLEYMPNGDLRSHLDRTPPSWTATELKMALAVAEGLAYVHSFSPPIVHRDLKARNILLDAKMRAKISDFGVSRLQSENATMSTGVGTSRWLAPEVIIGGGKYTELCDIYSFGVLLVELDTHTLPFAEQGRSISEFNLLQQVARGQVQPSVSSSCHPQIALLVGRCVATNPADRPNALEVAFILRKLLRS